MPRGGLGSWNGPSKYVSKQPLGMQETTQDTPILMKFYIGVFCEKLANHLNFNLNRNFKDRFI
jgi:hypothetical protein